MEFRHLVLSALLFSSLAAHADQVGWPGQPGRPQQPQQPQLPQRPQQPQLPQQPQQPQDPWSRRDDRREDRRDRRDQIDPWGNQSRAVEENVQSYFQGSSRLDLLADMYVRQQLQGLKIRDITIVASTEMGNGMMSLALNGQSIENSKQVARQMSSYTFRVDPFANDIGRTLSRIDLVMQGRFYVDKIIFNVLENNGPAGPGPGLPPVPQNEIIRQQLNERIQQEGGLELFRMFNLANEKRGQEVRRITILARSDRGFAQASLMVNNQQSGLTQTLGMGESRFSFDVTPGMRVAQELQGLRLYFRGDVLVEEVSIELGRGDGRFPGPIPPVQRRVEQIVNQRLYDTNGVALSSLMQIPSVFAEREVESVELTLRNSDMGVRLKLCQVLFDRTQSVNCAAPVTVSAGPQIVRLQGVNFARLRETQLSTRMGMIDIDRIAINFR